MVPYLVVPVALALKSLLVAGVVAVALTTLCMARIHRWLRQRGSLIHEDPRRMGVSLHERLQNGKYRTVYGVFDPVRKEFTEAEIVESDEVDQELRRAHRKNPLLVYR
jgi:hypothetical protein